MQDLKIMERIAIAKDCVKYHKQYSLIAEAQVLVLQGKELKAHKLLKKYGF